MIIADTGFWVALFNHKDTFHRLAYQRLGELNEPLLVTLPVVTETCYLLQKRVGPEKSVAFLRSHQRGVFQLFDLDRVHFPRIIELMSQYANLPMDFADASLVILAEVLGHGRILSTDSRDFQTYRWKNRYSFENLLLQSA